MRGNRFARVLSIVFLLVVLGSCSRQVPDPGNVNEFEGISQFEISPLSIEAGQEISLTWKATARVVADQILSCQLVIKTVSEESSTEVACETTMTLMPLGETSYQLLAKQGEQGWQSDVITVAVSVPSQNVAPFVEGDEYRLSKGSSLVVSADKGILINDSDVNGDKLSAKLIDDVRFGTLELAADGSFRYTNTGGTNLDFFNYVASDGELDSPTVTVLLRLLEPPPTEPDAYSATAGQTLTVDVKQGVLANDGLSVDYIAQLRDLPLNGTVQLNPDGSFSYTPGTNSELEDSFSYVAFNGEFSSYPTRVSITIIR
ncbi:MAG: cadherin-like domain-containing protein [Trueperaceae bacterium]|nr:cadherin-like domain-containing protein [Trueperaceae bacterium]